MKNISTHYKLKNKQNNLDFVDVKLDDDNLLFVDPRLIDKHYKHFKKEANCLANFFGHLVASVTSNSSVAKRLLSGVQEPSETRLGYGNKNSKGRGAGPTVQDELIEAIRNNPIMKEKKVNRFGDLSFFISDLGPDRVSDITTKVIKYYLIQFTQEQCKKHSIPMKPFVQKQILDPKSLAWYNNTVELPYNIDKKGIERPIIFVPKQIVSNKSRADSNINCFFRFARNYVRDNDSFSFFQHLPHLGKNNSLRVKEIDASIENPKEACTDWVRKHPNILEEFWLEKIDNIRSLTDDELGEVVY